MLPYVFVYWLRDEVVDGQGVKRSKTWNLRSKTFYSSKKRVHIKEIK